MTKHNVVHIEIPTRNSKESGEFYSKLFGWQISRDEGMDYTMWKADETSAGGFIPVDQHTKVSNVLIYVDSDDIEADLKKVEKLGGKTVTPKTEIPTVGWFATFTDLTGNLVALFKASQPM